MMATIRSGLAVTWVTVSALFMSACQPMEGGLVSTPEGVFQVERIGETRVPDSIDVNLQFTGADSLQGQAGCNSFRAAYKRNGNGLTIDSVSTTRKKCPSDRMTVERSFVSALKSVQSMGWNESDRLILMGENGRAAIIARRQN